MRVTAMFRVIIELPVFKRDFSLDFNQLCDVHYVSGKNFRFFL